jgi:hypothetical protein
MPAPADEPIRRCNLYLYTTDVEWLQKRYGHGWSEHVRKAVRELRRESENKEVIIPWPMK